MNQDRIDSAIFKNVYYKPPILIFQHLPVKEKVRNVVVNRMAIGSIIDTLSLVDICEIVKMGGKVIRIYEGVIYREIFKISPFGKGIEKIFTLKQNYKDESNDLLQG